MKVLTPKEFFGFTPGDDYELAHWTKIVEYFDHLQAASDRVLVENMGPTTDGHPFLKATFSAPKNLADLAKHDDSVNEMYGIIEQEVFVHGFQLGAKIMLETLMDK